jgi:hypothetical protein
LTATLRGEDPEVEMQASSAASEFLARRIAVAEVLDAEVRRQHRLMRLRQRGYEVFAVNPNADRGRSLLPRPQVDPSGVEAVVIGTGRHRRDTMQNAWIWDRPCLDASLVRGRASGRRDRVRQAAGVTVIDGGCPLMFGQRPTPDWSDAGRVLSYRQGAEKCDDAFVHVYAMSLSGSFVRSPPARRHWHGPGLGGYPGPFDDRSAASSLRGRFREEANDDRG